MPMSPDTRLDLPSLQDQDFEETSDDSIDYNCIAYAVGIKDQWWWPDSPDAYWPPGVLNVATPQAFIQAYAALGFQLCNDSEPEDSFLKVAIYLRNGVPQHAAVQLEDGRWSSKIGSDIDIAHRNLECLNGFEDRQYGEALIFMRKPRAS